MEYNPDRDFHGAEYHPKYRIHGVAADMVISPQVRTADMMARQAASTTSSMSWQLANIRDVIRGGVLTIPVSFSLSPKWVRAMAEFRRKPKKDCGRCRLRCGSFENGLLDKERA